MKLWNLGLFGIAVLCCGYVGKVVAQKGVDHVWTRLVPPRAIACPKPGAVQTILVLGQSHGANTGEARMIPARTGNVMENGGNCWALQDPIKGPPESGGSIWPAFADAYGKPVLIVDMAISGSSIDQWVEPAQLARVESTVASLRRAGHDPVIIWMNGETDAAREVAAASYLAKLDAISRRVGPARWFITRESRCYDRQEKYRPLDEARDSFVAQDPSRRRIGPDLDAIPTSLRQADMCHLNRTGQTVFGSRMGHAFGEAFSPRFAKQ